MSNFVVRNSPYLGTRSTVAPDVSSQPKWDMLESLKKSETAAQKRKREARLYARFLEMNREHAHRAAELATPSERGTV